MNIHKIFFINCIIIATGNCDQNGHIPREILDFSQIATLRASEFHSSRSESSQSPDGLWQFQSEYWSIPKSEFSKWNDKVSLSSRVKNPQFYDARVNTLLQLKESKEIIIDDINQKYDGILTKMQWSPKGTWAQLDNRPIFYRVADFPDCIVKNKPFQQYALGVSTVSPDSEDLESFEPFLDTYIVPLPNVSVWEDENTVYTLKMPKDSYSVFEGTYLVRHHIVDQKVDFFLRSVKGWKNIQKDALASGDPEKFYNAKWKFVRSTSEVDNEPIRPLKINFIADELPRIVLEHPEVLNKKESYQKSMKEFKKKVDILQKERDRATKVDQ